MDPHNAELALNYVMASSSLTERLLAQNQAYAAREKAAADKCDALLEKMLSVAAIEPHQKTAAASMLRDPAQALDLLYTALDKMQRYKTAAEKVAATSGMELGRPAAPVSAAPQQKTASNIAYLGVAGSQLSPALASVMASIMNDNPSN